LKRVFEMTYKYTTIEPKNYISKYGQDVICAKWEV